MAKPMKKETSIGPNPFDAFDHDLALASASEPTISDLKKAALAAALQASWLEISEGNQPVGAGPPAVQHESDGSSRDATRRDGSTSLPR